MEYDGKERRMISADHVELAWIKKILIGSIFALLTHFAAGIWWAATITANMTSIHSDISRLSDDMKSGVQDRYRGIDAKKDFSVVEDRMSRNEARISRLEDFVRSKV